MRTGSFRIKSGASQIKGGPQLPNIINHKAGGTRVMPRFHQFDNQNVPITRPIVTANSEHEGAQSRQTRQAQPLAPLPQNLDFDADMCMDELLKTLENNPLSQTIEVYIRAALDAQTVIFWQEVPNLQLLYSPTLKITCQHTEGIVGNAFFTRQLSSAASGQEHPAFKPEFDGKFCPNNSPVMVFPIIDYNNSIMGICLAIRPSGSQPFTKAMENFCQWFTRKLRSLTRWVKPKKDFSIHLLDVTQIQRTDQYLKTTLGKIASFFSCRAAEIWKLDKTSGEMTCFSDDVVLVNQDASGIAGNCLLKTTVVNCPKCQLHAYYNPTSDGNLNEAVLAYPITESQANTAYCVILRGPQSNSIFTAEDEEFLKQAAPHYVLSLENANTFSMADDEFQHVHMERESLGALLEVAELLGNQRDKDKLLLTIMEKGRQLTNADRCALFIVNDDKDKLITSFQNGLENAITIPINKGIAGHTYAERTIMNITDAYENQYFDPTTDKETGYRTRSILSVPIYNNRTEIIGVTEMINKNDNKPFTQWDINVIQIFNVFAGISLENVFLYKEAQEKGEQLRSLLDVSFSITKREDVQRLLKDILSNARKQINAECSSLFLLDETSDSLTSYIADGGTLPPNLPLSSGIVAYCAKSKKGIINNDVYHSPEFNRTVDISTGFKTNSLLAVPVLSGSGELIGVVEMVNKVDNCFNNKDLEIVQNFAVLSSVAIENDRLKGIATNGSADVEMSKWITEPERTLTDQIPAKLKLTEEQQKVASSLNFFSPDFRGINHIRELFYLFSKFNILRDFKISNELFFRFIYKIRSTYNDVPYHNWMHACDVTEYVAYELKTSGFDEMLSPLEKFALLLSAVCHDANHEGFNNIFNIKAQTPLGLLFKDTSVMETHHLTVSIDILSDDSYNLIYSLSEEDTKKMWQMMIQNILATDMAKHFEMIKTTKALVDAGEFDLNKEEHRRIAMSLLLKVADISNVSRPFELADNWCDILNVEFYRQGDLEKATGIGLTSPLNDREHPDKPKSQIGFYNFVCLPLYNVVATIFPKLQVNADSVKSNLAVWMELAEKKKKEDEAKAAAAGAAQPAPAPAAK
ncbi:3'5'-cyclic nucleotide phosphodiesterase family protein [Trichomonas vaginalis G3]|uniref:3'5'-cyclic nucleotide phosphodiesterase family protein n=1 Tax=Trichomonas vaginalis (strain ATCC PRA-98 / G3) TaxID=412133 RepID=A2DYU6_TRIV3|nr:cyclic nucleotide phosphodiesterase family [Trichomonas vaginalis G3]EAY14486.1 3'5'-cyclic nucleotide phosphodiesterase family protein [Trichomonas vaginalis G3]KAI5519678.1 cyclic nucleotide phosphodiesterase family [Trichomonas vaginalis G3]|eukprot:XP_001326709.1 3'5'-cyclic nucleotide phosphodiesterase family protein [Trichomonas vaginalis G3]